MDLGCGTGYESKSMQALGFSVTGMDFSEASLNIAKAHSPEIDFIWENALKPFHLGRRFDACICIALVIHIDKQDLEIFFSNLYTALKPGAQLLLVFKQGSSLDETASLKHYLGKDFFRPVYLYRAEDLCKACEGCFSFLREIPSNHTAWKNIVLKRT